MSVRENKDWNQTKWLAKTVHIRMQIAPILESLSWFIAYAEV